MLYRIILASRSTTFKSLWTISVKRVLSLPANMFLNETDSRLNETIWRQTEFQLKHAGNKKPQGHSHHSGPSQFSGTEQQLLWEVPVELLLWPSLMTQVTQLFTLSRIVPHSSVPSWYFLFVRDLFFGKNLVYCYCDWQKTAWKDNKPEETTVRRLHIWIFSSLRIWAHLILQQESWKAQHKVRAMRDLYMKNTLSQRDIQLFFSQEILFYKASVFARLSRFLFPLTSKTTRTWLGEKNWLTRMTTVIRNCVSEVYRGIPEDFFPNAFRSMSSHFSIDSSLRRNRRSAKRVPFYISFISSTKNFGAIMTSCDFQYIPSHYEM